MPLLYVIFLRCSIRSFYAVYLLFFLLQALKLSYMLIFPIILLFFDMEALHSEALHRM